MNRYHLIKGILGGSDVYDESGKQVGYSLPAITGDGEDFYDMEGNPLGMSFDDEYGGFYVGNNGSTGSLDPEFLMGQHIYMHGVGDMGEKHEPDPWETPMPGFDSSESDAFGSGDDFGPDY